MKWLRLFRTTSQTSRHFGTLADNSTFDILGPTGVNWTGLMSSQTRIFRFLWIYEYLKVFKHVLNPLFLSWIRPSSIYFNYTWKLKLSNEISLHISKRECEYFSLKYAVHIDTYKNVISDSISMVKKYRKSIKFCQYVLTCLL